MEVFEVLELRFDLFPFEMGRVFDELQVKVFVLAQKVFQVCNLTFKVGGIFKFVETNLPVIFPQTPVDDPTADVTVTVVFILFFQTCLPSEEAFVQFFLPLFNY